MIASQSQQSIVTRFIAGPTHDKTLPYPVLVVAANKLTAPLWVQDVERGRAERAGRPVLGKRLFCKQLSLNQDQHQITPLTCSREGRNSDNKLSIISTIPTYPLLCILRRWESLGGRRRRRMAGSGPRRRSA
jgi:hypothetical protein